MVLPEVFVRYRSDIEAELRAVTEANPCLLNTMLHYHLGWARELEEPKPRTLGKLVRGTLCVASCRALGSDYRKALPAAAAVELLHNFSLIHDDIEDISDERHHQPSLWKLWGEAQAINAGDAVFALAHLALLRLAETGIAPQKLIHSLKVLDEACLKLCEGQYLDVAYEKRVSIGIDDYFDMITKKTAALMAASAFLGALLAMEVGEDAMINSFYYFGKELGLAYQIRDDILGVWGSEEKTGKPTGNDLIKKKKTLPVVYAFQRNVNKDKEKLLEIYRKQTIARGDIAEVMEILDKVNAKSYSQALAERHCYQALKYIEGKASGVVDLTELKEIAIFFISRDY